jgi:hypothetical protein
VDIDYSWSKEFMESLVNHDFKLWC